MKTSKILFTLVVCLLLAGVVNALNASALSEEFTASAGKSVYVGECSTAVNKILVRNTGSISSSYTVSVEGTAGGWASYAPASFMLKPAESRYIYIYIKAPCGSKGDYTLNTFIESKLGLKKVIRQDIIITENQNIGIEPVVYSLETDPCETAVFKFNLKNNADFPETYEFTAGDFPGKIRFSTNNATIGAGESKLIAMYATPDCEIWGNYTIDFTTKAKLSKSAAETAGFSLEVKRNYDFSLVFGGFYVPQQNVTPTIEPYSGDYYLCEKEYGAIPVLITNNKKFPNTYHFELEGGNSWLSISGDSVTLNSGESAYLNINAAPPEPMRESFNITLKALSELGEVEKSESRSVYVDVCYLPVIAGEVKKIKTYYNESFVSLPITNLGSKTANYRLELAGPDWIEIEPSMLQVPPAGEGTFSLHLSPTAETAEGKYVLAVKAIVENDKFITEHVKEITVYIKDPRFFNMLFDEYLLYTMLFLALLIAIVAGAVGFIVYLENTKGERAKKQEERRKEREKARLEKEKEREKRRQERDKILEENRLEREQRQQEKERLKEEKRKEKEQAKKERLKEKERRIREKQKLKEKNIQEKQRKAEIKEGKKAVAAVPAPAKEISKDSGRDSQKEKAKEQKKKENKEKEPRDWKDWKKTLRDFKSVFAVVGVLIFAYIIYKIRDPIWTYKLYLAGGIGIAALIIVLLFVIETIKSKLNIRMLWEKMYPSKKYAVATSWFNGLGEVIVRTNKVIEKGAVGVRWMGKPTFVAAGKNVYQYFEVRKSFDNKDIEKVSFRLKVSKRWLEKNNVPKRDVKVVRYNGELWAGIGTEIEHEDKRNVYYKADCKGLSFFAIVGKAKPVVVEKKPEKKKPEPKPKQPKPKKERKPWIIIRRIVKKKIVEKEVPKIIVRKVPKIVYKEVKVPVYKKVEVPVYKEVKVPVYIKEPKLKQPPKPKPKKKKLLLTREQKISILKWAGIIVLAAVIIGLIGFGIFMAVKYWPEPAADSGEGVIDVDEGLAPDDAVGGEEAVVDEAPKASLWERITAFFRRDKDEVEETPAETEDVQEEVIEPDEETIEDEIVEEEIIEDEIIEDDTANETTDYVPIPDEVPEFPGDEIIEEEPLDNLTDEIEDIIEEEEIIEDGIVEAETINETDIVIEGENASEWEINVEPGADEEAIEDVAEEPEEIIEDEIVEEEDYADEAPKKSVWEWILSIFRRPAAEDTEEPQDLEEDKPDEELAAERAEQEQLDEGEGIPHQEWDEDTQKTIDLSLYFHDPDGDSLSYSNSELDHIDVQYNGEGLATLTPEKDWFGEEIVVFTADDGEGGVINSNIVRLTVNNVEEPPTQQKLKDFFSAYSNYIMIGVLILIILILLIEFRKPIMKFLEED